MDDTTKGSENAGTALAAATSMMVIGFNIGNNPGDTCWRF